MKTLISTLALTAALGFSGFASADDAMSAPMASDAMSTPMETDAMGADAMSSMTPDEMLAACLEKAGMEMDAMKKDDATKACHDEHNMAMKGDAMGGDAMGGDAMAPMETDGMSAPAM